MNILCLDIGMRRTGVAFVETNVNVPLALDTIQSETQEEMIEKIMTIVREKKIDRVIIGLPLLLSGGEGEQSEYVRSCAELLKEEKVEVEFIDERYTTSDSQEYDGDARAACELLRTYMQKNPAL